MLIKRRNFLPLIGADRAWRTVRLTRRELCVFLAGAASTAGAAVWITGNESAFLAQSVAFIHRAGDRLMEIVNGSADPTTKRQWVEQLIAEIVDVRGIARFALVRVWNQASETQRDEIVRFLPRVLVGALSSSVGGPGEVSFTIGRAIEHDQEVEVLTTVLSDSDPPRQVN